MIIDLTTLSGWASLSSGAHNIQIVAKASGYRDSEKSAAVSVTKAATTQTLAAGTYKWIDTPSLQSFSETFNFTSNGVAYASLGVHSGKGQILYVGAGGEELVYFEPTWSNDNYKTITLDSNQRVTTAFYKWAIKQGNLKETVYKSSVIVLDDDDINMYLVLKVNGTIAEVVRSSENSEITQAFGNNNIYANSTLDTYLSGTYYNSLSTNIRDAIVPKTFQQDSWYYNYGTSGGSGNPIYQGAGTFRLGLGSATYGESITRNCYALSVQDIIDYLEVTPSMTASNSTLTAYNVYNIFDHFHVINDGYLTDSWLRSASAEESDTAFEVYGAGERAASAEYVETSAELDIRPAFTIDLLKVNYRVVHWGI